MRRAVQLALAGLLASTAGAGASARAPRIDVVFEGIAPPLADKFAVHVLDLHNRERARVGMPPLVWSRDLADDARYWAQVLAKNGMFEHAPADLRGGEGENLFKGTAGAYSIDEMIGGFIEERSDFRPGKFPDVSRNGNWESVGHYTQLIWRGTREVGCAVERGRGWDVLACRYEPAGNVIGMRVP
ncbi:MAG: SCP-like extracellular [Sphingomonadales bacterium]|nr:SCP-like extracellular [Sphingomonadales bacterium]